MQRRLCAAILVIEALVLGLTTPVLISVRSLSTGAAVGIGVGMLVACLLVSGLLRSPWGLWLGWAIQVVAVALGFLVTAMFFLGVVFLALWATAVNLGATIERDRAAWGRAHPPDP